ALGPGGGALGRSGLAPDRRLCDRPAAPPRRGGNSTCAARSEEHTSELQSPCKLVCRLLLEKKTRLSRVQDVLRLIAAALFVPIISATLGVFPGKLCFPTLSGLRIWTLFSFAYFLSSLIATA